MGPIYTWKRNGLADESLPWQYSLPPWLLSLCVIIWLHHIHPV